MRLRPASAAAAEKLVKERRMPGTPSEVVSNATWSVAKKLRRAVAAAPLKVLWPDVYEGNGGVGSNGSQSGSGAVSGLPSRSAWRMAVTGRQNSSANLMIQQTRPASARLRLSSANKRALSARLVLRARATSWAMRFQWPGGVDVPSP